MRALLVEIMAYGMGPTIIDDLRVWSQEQHTEAERDAILAKRRYDRLGEAAKAVLVRALELSAVDARRLTADLDDLVRTWGQS